MGGSGRGDSGHEPVDPGQGHFESDLRRSAELGDRHGEAAAESALANIAGGRGAPEQAIKRFRRALALYVELGDEAGEARACWSLAWEEFLQGDHEQARTGLMRALRLYVMLEDRAGEADARSLLAYVQLRIGIDAARKWRRKLEPMKGRSPWHSRHDQVRTQEYLRFKDGVYEDARAEYSRALDLYKDLGDRSSEARIHSDLAYVSLEQEAHERARVEYTRALKLHCELEDPAGEARVRRDIDQVEQVIRRIRDLEPAAYADVAKLRASFYLQFALISFAFLAVVLVGIWALAGMDSTWLFYMLFIVFVVLFAVLVLNSRAPVKNGVLGFACGVALTIIICVLIGGGWTLALQALPIWAWACGMGAVKGRRRIGHPTESEIGLARSTARRAALADPPSKENGADPD